MGLKLGLCGPHDDEPAQGVPSVADDDEPQAAVGLNLALAPDVDRSVIGCGGRPLGLVGAHNVPLCDPVAVQFEPPRPALTA